MNLIIHDQEYEFPDNLSAFVFYKHKSSNVDIIGINPVYDQILVQFNSGSVFVYNDVSKELMDQAANPEKYNMPDNSPLTVGKLVANYLVKKYPSVKVAESAMIIPIYQGEVMLKEDCFDYKKNMVGQKNDIVRIISESETSNLLIVKGTKGEPFTIEKSQILRKKQ